MKKKFHERYPSYLPFYYVVFLIFRKFIRQSQLRYLEAKARKLSVNPEFCDSRGDWVRENELKNPIGAINKPAFWIDEDLKVPTIKELINKFVALKKLLDSKQLRYCSPAGTFIPATYLAKTDKSKTWENVWGINYSGVRPRDTVLDLGGASTILSFYLASMGCCVRVIDKDWGNCGIIYNSNYVGKKMNWDIKAYDYDLSKRLPFEDATFDSIFSVCVVEHLPCETRRLMMKEVNRVLKPDGIVFLTFDYVPERDCLFSDKGLRYAFKDKIERDIIHPSGLEVYGNKDWVDAFPEKCFGGALFLKKCPDSKEEI
jgi:2-polyprenyl-3-methyl-5-hydroxy-6-metoxy-1,4-benzoquinol methylase